MPAKDPEAALGPLGLRSESPEVACIHVGSTWALEGSVYANSGENIKGFRQTFAHVWFHRSTFLAWPCSGVIL